MQRRKMLAALGSVAVGGATAVSTGAFTSVQAERDITISTAGDASAYLGITPFSGPNGQYASTSADGTVSLDFTSTEVASDTGLNDEAKINIENVLNITNNGTEGAYVTVKVEDSDGNVGQDAAAVSQFAISGDQGDVDFARTAGSYDGDKLPPGESAGLGFFFNFSGPDENFGEVVNDIETLTFVAATSEEELNRFKP